MPNCRVCGVDIPEPGLCAECEAEQAAVKNRRKAGSLPLVIILALGVLAVTATAVIIVLPGAGTPGTQAVSGQAGDRSAGDSGSSSAAAGGEALAADTAGSTDSASAPGGQPGGDTAFTADAAGSEALTAPDAGSTEEFGNKNAPVRYDITKVKNLPPIDDRDEYIDWMLAHTNESEAALSLRWERAQLIIQSGQGEFADPAALRAYLLTPRELFTRGQNLFVTYGALPLQIGYGQTITAPNVMAMMTTSLHVQPEDKVLEIGTGSGYQSAVLARLTNHVYSIEIIKELYEQTDKLFKSLEARYPSDKNIVRKLDDGYYGWAEYAPFDKIIVTCSIDHLPPSLIRQLKVGGTIIVPLGPPYRQFLMRIQKVRNKNGEIALIQKDVYDGMGVIFVPFTDSAGKSYSK
jgi:protein-L-isoaspartate(D-aspartate) O-methyltransferase